MSKVLYDHFCDFGLTIGNPKYFPPSADKNAVTFFLGMQMTPFFQERCKTKPRQFFTLLKKPEGGT